MENAFLDPHTWLRVQKKASMDHCGCQFPSASRVNSCFVFCSTLQMEIIPANSSLVLIGIAICVVITLKNKQAKELTTDRSPKC